MPPAAFGLILSFFETPLVALAAAAGAASLPIIIHLLNRKRFRVVTWAAMRFLQVSERTVERGMSEGSIPYAPLPKRRAWSEAPNEARL